MLHLCAESVVLEHLQHVQAAEMVLKQHVDAQQWSVDVLSSGLQKVMRERDNLYEEFQRVLEDVSQKRQTMEQLLVTSLQRLQSNLAADELAQEQI